MHAEDLPWNLGSIEFPVDSSSRFLFTARTDRHADTYTVYRRTDANKHPIHAGVNGNNKQINTPN